MIAIDFRERVWFTAQCDKLQSWHTRQARDAFTGGCTPPALARGGAGGGGGVLFVMIKQKRQNEVQ